MLTIDASVAVKLIVAEPQSDLAIALATSAEPFFAPDLVLVEVANALYRRTRAGDLGSRQAIGGLANLRTSFGRIAPSAPYAAHALALALDLGHQVYDCVYLAAAIAEDAPVVTADDAFLQRLAGTHYSRHAVSLADAARRAAGP